MNEVYLGVSYGFHDSACAIAGKYGVIAALTEESFSRKKHDNSFPTRSIREICRLIIKNGYSLQKVCYFENPSLKLHREFNLFGEKEVRLDGYRIEATVRHAIKTHLPFAEFSFSYVDHHRSHCSVSFGSSPYQSAKCFIFDAVGEYACTSIWNGVKRNGKLSLEKIYEEEIPYSLGLIYSLFTRILGFEVNEGEYKLMGLSGYGLPDKNVLRKLNSWYYERDDDWLNKIGDIYTCKPSDELIKTLDVKPSGNLDWLKHNSAFFEYADKYGLESAYKNIPLSYEAQRLLSAAASIQQFLVSSIQKHFERFVSKGENICLGGGVALNSRLNQLLLEKGFPVFIPPSPTDAGSAIGAALMVADLDTSTTPCPSPYIAFREETSAICIADYASQLGLKVKDHVTEAKMVYDAAKEINDGNIVGWFNGSAEWGPRALGSRSILANPTLPNMKELINSKVKFREPYRPFAPSVIIDDANKYFVLPTSLSKHSPYAYMLATCNVRDDHKDLLSTITHIDGTARVQVVWPDLSPTYYRLIKEFGLLSGVGVLTNTSFNISGEPTVSSYNDALRTFLLSGLDILYIENYSIRKVS